MKILVVSHEHGLLPFAYRLKREGHDVQIIVGKDRYAKAWAGRLEKFPLPKDASKDELEAAVRAVVEESDTYVLSDSLRWSRALEGVPHLYRTLPYPGYQLSNPQLGAWFDGEHLHSRHLVLTEPGLWPGGLGPNQPGALTLVRPTHWPTPYEDALGPVTEELKSLSFKGLVRVGLELTPEGEVNFSSYQAGWPFLHTHAFISECPRLGDVLMGQEVRFEHRFVVAVPVSVPPWPFAPKGGGLTPTPIEMPRDAMRQVFFHDVEVRETDIRTAGLDGLVGVAIGAADHLLFARQRVMEVIGQMGLPEKQFRSDAGVATDQALAVLESLGLGV